MTFEQYLLTVLSEECAEVAHRASKAARFGLLEIQTGQDYSNWQRICSELDDVLAIIRMLEENSGVTFTPSADAMIAKQRRVLAYARYSKETGNLI